ncbi:MAG: gliding motility-associated C-terminal domain-containing protein [Flavobacteriales bacterium]|nr:gliding motility-associated C-terminal domain-containing protein [Flavobacteriales bacterium]
MKRTLLIIPLLFIFLNVLGQNWLKGTGGAGNDEALDITSNGQGGFLVSGFFSYSTDFNGTVLNSLGEIDAFVAQTNPQGEISWVKQFGGTGSDAAYANDIDASGNIFVSGYFSGTMTVDGTTLNSNSGSQDVFLAKLDPTGNLLWIKTFGGFDHDFVYDLAVDQAGNAIITGNFKGTITVGSNTYNSVIDPEDNEPSYDIFVVKYDASGNVLWSKNGQANHDDRGTGLAVNSNNEIALIGQFSDTLTLTNIYPNQVYNSGFVMMFDSDGDEMWMRKMSASMCIPYDIVFYQDSLMYITGDFTGQLAIFTTPLTTTNSPYLSKLFLTKMNTQGDVLWLENDGSDTQVSSRAVDVDASGNAYITGYFKCRMDEYSQQYGDGVFYSADRRDVFVTQYSSTGTRNWERQFGGPGDDVAWDMVIQGTQPIVVGAFSKYFHAPNSGSFLSTGWTTDQPLFLPNSPSMNYCTDTHYGSFATIESTGQQDILIAKPVDLSRQPYDYFSRNGTNCDRDFLTPCINGTCPDTIQSCELVGLEYESVTGSNGFIGPTYNFLWSTGSTATAIGGLGSGTYWLQVSRDDNCYSNSDSVVVIVHDIPNAPLISDDVVVNTEAASPDRIFVCYPDSVHLSMSGIDTINNLYGWSWSSSLIQHPFLDTTITTSGLYTAHHQSPAGCETATDVLVHIDDWANEDTLDPHILVGTSTYDLSQTDTLIACSGDMIQYLVIDSSHYQTVGLSMPYFSSDWSISFPDIPSSMTYFDWYENETGDLDTWMMGNSFEATESTWVILDVELTDHCNGDTSTYILHHEFYLDVTNFNTQEYGNHRICPGDTLQIGVNGGAFYHWTGPAIISPDTLNSITVNSAGTYEWTTSVLTPSGSTCSESDTFRIRNLEAPDITMVPSNGVICPNDSVQMTAPPGSNYQWIGPNNAVVGSVQTIWANTPGFYFCEMVNTGGCFLISNEVEVRGFNTPYISAEPQQTICEGGTVTLTVFANEGSILDWPSPLVDGLTEQDIYQAGYYEVTASFCGITDTLGITVIDVSPEVNLNIAGYDTICASELLEVHAPSGYYSYEWNTGSQDVEIEITQSGMYFLTAENFDGCIGHSDTLYVEVLPAPEPPTLSDTTICLGGTAISYVQSSGQPVYWFTQQMDSLGIFSSITTDSVTASFSYYAAHFNGACFSVLDTASINLFQGVAPPLILGSTTLCPGDLLQLSTDSSQTLSYSWLLPDSTFVNGTELGLSAPDSGIYTLFAEHPVCGVQTVSEYVQLVTASDFSIVFSMGDSLNCLGDSVWLVLPGSFSELSWLPYQSPLDSILILENSEVWASVVDTNGCGLNTDTVHVQFQAPPSALALPHDTICQGETAILNVNSINILLLDDGQNQSVITSPFESDIIASDTAYIFLFADSVGCLSPPMNWQISATQVPGTLEISGDTSLCEGEQLQLSVSPSNLGIIVFFDEFSDTLGVASNGQLQINNVSDGNPAGGAYAILEIDGCTVQSAFLEINVLPLPDDPNLIIVGNGCPEDTVLVYASDSTSLDHFWIGPNGFSSTETILVFDPIEANEQGTYSLRIEQNSCSSDTSSIEIAIAPVPDVELIPDTVICFGDILDLILDHSYDQVLWSTNETGEIISVSDSGIYWVTVTNEFGCWNSDTTIVETVTCNLITSNIITPNGDGYNDVFKLEAEGLVEVHVKIFSRFGKLIYEWRTLDGAWDGTTQDTRLNVSDGTYYFVGNYLDVSGEYGTKKGYIQVIR